MKKFLAILGILLLSTQISSALTFDSAFEEVDSTPMMVLLYANWAENRQACLTSFKELEKEFGDRFNFIVLDIASYEMRSFNRKYSINPNLPYVLMLRDGGKIQRYFNSSCLRDYSCAVNKIKLFTQ